MTTPEELLQYDREHVWHPFTQMRDWAREEQIVIERGEGVYLVDTRGRRYLDGTASMWTNAHGHNVPALNAAITDQLGRIAHSTLLGQASAPSALLAKRLADLAPSGLSRVFYSDNGSTAMEVAAKMAFQYWRHKGDDKRTSFVKLDLAYHGDTIGAVSLGGVDLFHAAFGPLLFKTHSAPAPFPYRCPVTQDPVACRDWALSEMRAILEREHKTVAAVVMEPLLQGAGGMIVHPEGYLRGVRALCDEFGLPLILDEILTGFGRCGAQWACDIEGVRPDILATAKGLTGGYLPLAATLCTDDIYNAFLGDYGEFKTFFHGHTFTGNQLGCAVALVGLDLYENGLWPRIRDRAAQFKTALQSFYDMEHVGDVRVCGLAAGVELVRDRATREPYPIEEQWGIRVCRRAREKGVIIRPLGNTIVLMPILASSESELAILLDVARESIHEVTSR